MAFVVAVVVAVVVPDRVLFVVDVVIVAIGVWVVMPYSVCTIPTEVVVVIICSDTVLVTSVTIAEELMVSASDFVPLVLSATDTAFSLDVWNAGEVVASVVPCESISVLSSVTDVCSSHMYECCREHDSSAQVPLSWIYAHFLLLLFGSFKDQRE